VNRPNPKTNDASRDTLHVLPRPTTADSEATELGRLKEQQLAWETFAASAVQTIPILIKQMEAVTQQTERAAKDMMAHLRALTTPAPGPRFIETSSHLSEFVVAMQFQDITRQQLEHVAQALDYWRTHLQDLLKGPQDEGAKKEIVVLQQLEQTYTMEAERRLHAAALAPDCQEPAPDEREQSEKVSGSVTLF
jgi:chemotaxis regulatin CheY-phosphate phosphatase CheZ